MEAMEKSNQFLIWVFLVGITSALCGAAYLFILNHLSTWIGPQSFSNYFSHGLILVSAGFLMALIERGVGPTGNVERLVDNIHEMGGNKERKNLWSLIPASLICIASGGAMGPEAPLVQTTGSLGSWVSDLKNASVSEKRTLTITGMAAGFTVLFGAPLGASLFALEILHRRGMEYYEALLPAIWGSLCGYMVYAVLTHLNLSPIWSFPYPVLAFRLRDFAFSILCGLLASIVAAAFIGSNHLLSRVFKILPLWARGSVGGLVLALLAYFSPYALTFGESQLKILATASPVASLLLLAFVFKFLGTSTSFSSGWKGGFIIPLFFMGAALGRFFHLVFPGTQEILMVASLMAALNAGVTKTPLGSVLVVTEMTGIRIFPTTVLSVMTAMLLTNRVGLIDSQRSRES